MDWGVTSVRGLGREEEEPGQLDTFDCTLATKACRVKLSASDGRGGMSVSQAEELGVRCSWRKDIG